MPIWILPGIGVYFVLWSLVARLCSTRAVRELRRGIVEGGLPFATTGGGGFGRGRVREWPLAP